MISRALGLLGLILIWVVPLRSDGGGVLAAFASDRGGGVMRIEMDTAGDPVGEPGVIFHDAGFGAAAKLRVSPDGRYVTLNAAVEGRDNFAIIDLWREAGPRVLRLDFVPEEHRLTADRVFVGGTDGHLDAIELSTGAIVARWNSRRQLRPAGHKPEDLFILGPEGLLLVSHQKDGKKGRLGSRLVVLRLADLSLVADLALPRDHPELHVSAKEAGPSPEVIAVDRATSRLVLTLDLYGALAFADLKAVLAGRWANYQTVSTADNGEWGGAFPDKLTGGGGGGRPLAIVSNASTEGGIAVFDVATARRLIVYPTAAGCAEFVTLDGGKTAATVLAGKRKRVVGDELENITTPGDELFWLDLNGAAAGEPGALTHLRLHAPLLSVAAVPGQPSWVAVARLEPAAVVMVDTIAREVVRTISLPGRPTSLQAWP